VFRPPQKRLLVVALVAALAATTATAFAAGLGGFAAGDLSGASSAVVGCDTDGFTTTYTTSSGSVTAVTVGGIADPACEGGSLSVTLVDSSNAAVGSGGPQTIPTDPDTTVNSVTVTLNPQPPTTQVAAVHVSITGP
jgi:hypothetical protein